MQIYLSLIKEIQFIYFIGTEIIDTTLTQINHLPLSWTYNSPKTKLSLVKIGRRSFWINGGNLSNLNQFNNEISKFSSKTNIYIRGCNIKTSNMLVSNGFKKTFFAKEAIIDLHFKKELSTKHTRRIKSLIKRGKIKEILFTKENKILFDNFLKETVHSHKPKLKHLFLDKLNTSTRFFVFEFTKDVWEGGILVSQNSETKMQGEQFFRKNNGKNGIMDVLVYELSNIFYKEGFKEFSLGEVPFLVNGENNLRWKAKLINILGRKIKYAYDYEKLRYFKSKFATRWDDIYICSNKTISFIDLFGIARKSNLLMLAIYKIFN